MKHRRIFALSSVLLLWMLASGAYYEEEGYPNYGFFSEIVLAMGLMYAILGAIAGLLGLLFLYNIYLACCSIFNFKNKIRLTIYDGIAFGSFIISIILIIRMSTY